ncbi:MAG: hypothetical protein M1829_005224 [Trizodia sp. TS-e1964]|nr:MAG: hypothetical protein M1829_005224 [Trizodia sp. TS-e1964]
MALTQPQKYFLPPDFDCPPDTRIRIGHVLTSPTLPYEPLNEDTLTPPPAALTLSTTKSGFTSTRSQLSTLSCGVWAPILELAFGASLGANLKRESWDEIEFAIDELDTTFISVAGAAAKAYIRSCVETEYVEAYLRGRMFRKSLYVVVGIKVARGARVEAGSGERMAWRDEKSFVFGYQVRKVWCRKGEMVRDREFGKGAFLDAEQSEEEREELVFDVGEEDVGIEEGDSAAFESWEDEGNVFLLPVGKVAF